MSADPGQPKLAGVVGFAVSHSLSPLIHTVWAAREGVNAYYLPVETPEGYDVFARTMDALQVIGFQGVNVTIPHKENALRYASSASDRAKMAGAANMLTFGERGVHADNSDIEGFYQTLVSVTGESTKKKTALLLGAGGAARGVVMAVQEAGYGSIIISNRTRKRADALANDLGGLKVIDWERKDHELKNCELIVNTTSLGMTGEPPLALDLSLAGKTAIVADIVYRPLETELLKAAQANGMATIDGLAMLMHQAAPGYRQWLGGEASVDDDLRLQLITEINRRKNTGAKT